VSGVLALLAVVGFLLSSWDGGSVRTVPAIPTVRGLGAVVPSAPQPCSKETIAAENAHLGTNAWRVDHPTDTHPAPPPVIAETTPIVPPATPTDGKHPAPTPTHLPAATPTTTAPTPTTIPAPTATPVPSPTTQAGVLNGYDPDDVPQMPRVDAGEQLPRLDAPIEGFASPISLTCGQDVSIYVSTEAPSYSLAIYRVGWYQGHGARLMYTAPEQRGIYQPAPIFDPATRMVSCPWKTPFVLRIPGTWKSGVYVVKLVSSTGFMRYTFFVLRDDTSTSRILAELPVFTYEAYNQWGGYSLYYGPGKQGAYTTNTRSYAVSFDRPFNEFAGLMSFARADYNQVRWMERQGFDLSYTTDVDTDLRGALLKQHRLFVSIGHDEYWSSIMRNNVTAARDAGVSLAFFGANDMYWHIRLKSSALGPDRIVICYRFASLDPVAKVLPGATTVNWRVPPLNDPENSLLGEMYAGVVFDATLEIAGGALNILPAAAHDGMKVDIAAPGVIGTEFDRVFDNGRTPANLTVLARSPIHCVVGYGYCPQRGTHAGEDVATATVYTAASGAKVFDAGSFQWGWGLDSDPIIQGYPTHDWANLNFQNFTTHIFDYLLQ
jgi:N,N-dimethylformamidase beta subunit-like protein